MRGRDLRNSTFCCLISAFRIVQCSCAIPKICPIRVGVRSDMPMAVHYGPRVVGCFGSASTSEDPVPQPRAVDYSLRQPADLPTCGLRSQTSTSSRPIADTRGQSPWDSALRVALGVAGGMSAMRRWLARHRRIVETGPVIGTVHGISDRVHEMTQNR